MLQFAGGRFSAHGVSFTMPDGFYLHDEQQDSFGLRCFTPDERVLMTVRIAAEGGNILEGLQAIFEQGSPMRPISMVQPITINGLTGYDVLYNGCGVSYYEARFRPTRGQVITCIAQSEQSSKINLKHSPFVQALLETIQAE
ncbi:hypothetical protein [Acutalibacter muris]|uniref:hypothetical protein n=1 Tax=Acutalibacter muris TaxID=1796620 RepID=UPI00272E63C8|nr:hypothetical protein [Acutalibacter muris]